MSTIPVFRIRALLFRTISKPIARKLESYSTSVPPLRNAFCSIGKVTDTISYTVHKISKPDCEKKEYEDQKFVEAGTEVVSELSILLLISMGLYYKYQNSKQEKHEILASIRELQANMHKIEKKLSSTQN